MQLAFAIVVWLQKASSKCLQGNIHKVLESLAALQWRAKLVRNCLEAAKEGVFVCFKVGQWIEITRVFWESLAFS